MWPIPLAAYGHLLWMKNPWSEGGAAVTCNVTLSLFVSAIAGLVSASVGPLAFNVPCTTVSDPHMQARG